MRFVAIFLRKAFSEGSIVPILRMSARSHQWSLYSCMKRKSESLAVSTCVQRGIYQYTVDPDGHGLLLTLTGRGTGMVYVDVKGIVNDAFLCVIVVR